MNKAELLISIAKDAGMAHAEVEKIFNATLSVITKSLKKEGKIQLIGFGSFEVRQRSARNGRNPRTGEVIKIKATKAPAFFAGKILKEAVK